MRILAITVLSLLLVGAAGDSVFGRDARSFGDPEDSNQSGDWDQPPHESKVLLRVTPTYCWIQDLTGPGLIVDLLSTPVHWSLESTRRGNLDLGLTFGFLWPSDNFVSGRTAYVHFAPTLRWSQSRPGGHSRDTFLGLGIGMSFSRLHAGKLSRGKASACLRAGFDLLLSRHFGLGGSASFGVANDAFFSQLGAGITTHF